MPIDPLVLELLEEATESGRSADDVCRDRPELLGEIRDCLRQVSLVQDELDALFPEEDLAGPALSSGPRPEVPGYAVGDVLGRGGMGVVYEARDLRLHRRVALKMMLNGGFAGPPELAGFRREAEALAALEHPNIVGVYDVGESRGLPYFTMEFVEGGNLAQRLGGIPQPAREAARFMAILAGAVESAHRGGIVHRDLKPANILLTAAGTPKITDFGLARRFEAGVGLSMTGVRIGTSCYMAPEQAAGLARVSGASTDVYSLGAILYEMLTGRPPFQAESAAETERQVIVEEPAPPSRLNARVPRDLETICLKCLQKDPRRRYTSAAALGADLDRFLRDEPIVARPVGSFERSFKWMRRHPARSVTFLSGLTITVAMLIAGWWLVTARAQVAQAIEEDLRVATQSLRRSEWGEARSALDRARGRLDQGGTDALRRRMGRAVGDLELVGRLAKIRSDRIAKTSEGAAHWSSAYEAEFREAGLLVMNEDSRVAAERIGGSDVQDALVAALDDWTLCASYVVDAHLENGSLDASREAWLLEVARQTDPDPLGWRDRLRDPSVRRDKQELARLAGSARIPETPVHLLVLLGELLQKSGGDANPFLLSVQLYHPDDLWVNFLLGYHALIREDTPEALRNLQAAMATRPEAAFVRHSLGEAFHRAGRLDEAFSHYAKAVQLAPEDASLRLHFGDHLAEAGRLPEAIEQIQRGLALAPDTSTSALLRKVLRRCHARAGDLDQLDSVWHRSLESTPPDHTDWDGYAEFCLYQGRREEYHAICRGLIEHFGSTEDAQVAERTGRACLLAPTSDEVLGRATALIDRALADPKASPDWARSYFLFAKGLAEYRHGRLESSIAIMDGPASGSLQPAPRLVSAMARHRLGQEAEALGMLAKAVLSGDWRKSRVDDREKWIYHILRREAEELMLPNLPAFLARGYLPRTNDERLCFLGTCQFEGRYRAAADLYAEVLASDPHRADDLLGQARYHAACTASWVGAGLGHDAGGLDEAGRLRWRVQARDWLRADLEMARKLSKHNAAGLRNFLEHTLRLWSTDPDLAGLRDPASCKGLLPSEQQDFQRLCRDLRSLVAETKF